MTRRFMLDTDSVSYALRGQGKVAAHILEHRPSELYISARTLAELRFGADKRDSKKLHRLIGAFIESVATVAFDKDAAAHFGRIAAALAGRGTPIGSLDAMIAGHAVAQRSVLVTNNPKHFGRVPGLRCENWL